MTINCPRGKNCPGSTNFSIQECYLSETTKNVPNFLITKMKKGTNWKERIVPGLIFAGFEYAIQRSENPAKIEIYQCPTCGVRIAFLISQGKNGQEFKRLGDDLDH